MEVRKKWMRGVEREEWRWFKRYLVWNRGIVVEMEEVNGYEKGWGK
jgi:hypothetical protein